MRECEVCKCGCGDQHKKKVLARFGTASLLPYLPRFLLFPTYLGWRRDQADKEVRLRHTRGLDGVVVLQDLALVDDLLPGRLRRVVLGLKLRLDVANRDGGIYLDKHLLAPHVLHQQLHLVVLEGVLACCVRWVGCECGRRTVMQQWKKKEGEVGDGDDDERFQAAFFATWLFDFTFAFVVC